MDQKSIYYGSALPPEDPVLLKCGPLTVLYQEGMIRSITFGTIELIRRIYVALRDKNWNTIPFTISDFDLSHDENNFSLSFNATHSQNEIHFLWRATIEGSKNGTLRFLFDGKALSSFERNRLGLCILLPLSLSGNHLSAHTTDNTVVDCLLPVSIIPHQPLKSLRAIKSSLDGVDFELTFQGDTFEMEDQRNWTDASFKIYSTPLDNPTPVLVEKGTVISQSVTLNAKLLQQQPVPHHSPVSISMTTTETEPFKFPEIGLMMNPSQDPGPQAVELLQSLSLTHCRVDIEIHDPDVLSKLKNAADFCVMLKTGAEIALYCENLSDTHLHDLKNALSVSGIPAKRFCIYDVNKVTSNATLSAVVPVLKEYAPDATIASGTDNYFVELNRNHPSLDLAEEMCYSVNPQVHTFDNVSIMENLPGITETLKTAILFRNTTDTIISPLTLRPRKSKKNIHKAGGSDPRQSGLFCSAWTFGALVSAIAGGVHSLTLYETTGENGCMPDDGSCVYPAYILFLWLSGLAGKKCRMISSSQHSSITGIVIEIDDLELLLLVNLTNHVQPTEVHGLPLQIVSKAINELQLHQATTAPLAWNSITGESHTLTDRIWKTELLPYEIVLVKVV